LELPPDAGLAGCAVEPAVEAVEAAPEVVASVEPLTPPSRTEKNPFLQAAHRVDPAAGASYPETQR
jgi:hypothetical protein